MTASVLDEDPFASDPLRSYLGSERLGVSGVERAAEFLLRGSRGRFQRTREDVVVECTPPVAGRDIHLTIREDLQNRIYAMFAGHIERLPVSCGGSIVVLDIPSRECLALVSYPSFDVTPFPAGLRDLES